MNHMRAIAAVTAAAVFLGGALAFGASGDRRYTRDRITFTVPAGWHLTLGRINGVVDPVTVFTASTFRVPSLRTSSGLCSRALRRGWRRDGAYVQLTEERDGASRKRMLRRVPQRPQHFRLNAKGGGGLCTPPDSGEIAFQARGRAFYVFYGFGPNASPATRAAAAGLLDAMTIAPRR
jgi:hypothetical protein